MIFYGKKKFRSNLDRRINYHSETREAVIYTVYLDERKARVKIQGSDEYIYCYFPTNWDTAPFWLRVGQAVRIRHIGGLRGRIELEGHSILRPTAQPGSSNPTIPTPDDSIITGLRVIPVPRGGDMRVGVSSGTVRFDGVTSSTIYIKMSATTLMVMGDGFKMGGVAEVLELDAAPASGLARYDLIVVGSDLVFDIVKGTAAASPVMPDIPSLHLLCGHILVIGGMTEVTQSNINVLYSTPVVVYLYLEAVDQTLSWSELSTDITVTAKDQYQNEILKSGGWYFTLEIVNGTGTLSNQQGQSGTSVSKYSSPSSASATFTYTRDQDSSDSSPSIKATISSKNVMNYIIILLLDDEGNYM